MNIKFLVITLFTTIFITNNYSLSSSKNNSKIIPNASYYIYDGDGNDPNKIVGGVPGWSKNVTFYTFDGNEITTEEHHLEFPGVEAQLDPNSPKPQPASCKIEYWDGVKLFFGLRKGEPGWLIVFYDKSGNKIAHHRYDKEENKIKVLSEKSEYRYETINYSFDPSNPQSIDESFHLDLSIAKDATLYKTALRN